MSDHSARKQKLNLAAEIGDDTARNDLPNVPFEGGGERTDSRPEHTDST
jgi:hypothetical protein